MVDNTLFRSQYEKIAPAMRDYGRRSKESWCITQRNNQAYATVPHLHDFIQLRYVRSGSALFSLGDITFQQKPRSLVFVPPLTEHTVMNRPAAEYCDIINIYISEKMLFDSIAISNDMSLGSFIYLVLVLLNLNLMEPGLQLKGPVAGKIEQLLDQICGERTNRCLYYSQHPPEGFIELLHMIALETRSCFKKYTDLIDRYSYSLTNTFQYIMENYMKDLPMDHLYRQAFMSKTAFHVAFKQATGKSPNQYLRYVRVFQACELLISTELSLNEIALMCGFGSLSDFGRVFKQLSHIQPGQYRQQYKTGFQV